jgi:peptidoglycan hydrolase CwlO-like protein
MKQMRPLDFKIGLTVMVAVLTAAVLVLATTDRGKKTIVETPGSASKAQIAALDGRLTALDAKVAAIQQAVAKLAARPGSSTGGGVPSKQIQKLTAQLQGTAQCMFEMQKEIDDLEGYLAFRTPLLRHRVTGACADLLKPRFGAR